MKDFWVWWDKTRGTLVLALRSLWVNKLRAFLSVLGIIIGVAAVISMTAFGEGSMQDALEDIKRQGATNVIVNSLKPPDDGSSQRRSFIANYGLTYRDYDQFLLIESVVRSVPMRIIAPQEIRRLDRMQQGRVIGTTQDYDKVNQIELAIGRFLIDSDNDQDEGDSRSMRNVCVLGSNVAEMLFPFEKPVGQTVVLNKHQFIVVGVLKDRMALTSSSGLQEDYNNDVYIPLRTCRARFGETVFIRQSGARGGEKVELHQVTLTVEDTDKVLDAGAAIEDMLSTSHLRKDWAVTVPLARLKEAERARDRYLQLLAFIAGISLFVGGIGIMNIMLATVTERTREIGIRRALGAKRKDITFQFLIEAITQTSLGGAIGVLVGFGGVYLIAWASQFFWGVHVPFLFSRRPVLISAGASIAVGIFFGLYPAMKASRLDPIEALRHE
ncbi:MAG: ABC transporter permease [Gemmataceae bacterium]|nr:ABC transporter permease [Gemmataceae bacterium]